MASSLRGVIPFNCEGEKYQLKMDFNAICSLEEELGISVDKLGETITSGARTLRSVFRIALSAHHPAMTDMQAGELITTVGPEKVALLIVEAVTAAFPQAEAGKSAENPRKPAGRGGRSPRT